MKVESLEVSSFKGVRHVNIKPGGMIVEITGRNGAGKSSVVDAIQWAIGGAKFAPETPVRKGNAKAEVVADLGDLRIRRTQTKAGSMTLDVTTRDGVPQKSPQALYSSIAFDPLAFVRAKPAEQRETLINAAGIRGTIASIDDAANAAKVERTDLGRQVNQLAAQVAALPDTPGPTEEVNSADLIAEIRDANDRIAENKKARTWYAEKKAEHAKAVQRVAELEQQLGAARTNAENLDAIVEQWAEKIEALADPDIRAMQDQLTGIEGTNRQIRDRANRKRLAAQLADVRAKHAAAERRIEEAAIAKADALTNSPLPIPGIGLTDDGVTLNGVPIGQANWAAQIRASVALAAAVSPKLKVALVREGSALDGANLTALEEAATAAGLQVWIERVTNGEKVGITIVDGEVAGDEGGVQ